MGKNLPPYAKRIGIGSLMSWSLDWGNKSDEVHFHHHSTRHRPGALKPIRKLKMHPRGAAGTFFSSFRRRVRQLTRGILKNFGRRFKNVQIRMMNPLDDEKRIPGD